LDYCREFGASAKLIHRSPESSQVIDPSLQIAVVDVIGINMQIILG